MAPEALRRRLAHGNVYGPEKIDAALGNYFRAGNLSACAAGAPVGGRPRRRLAPRVSRSTWHQPAVGDPGAGRRGAVGRARRRPPRAAGGPHRPAGQGRADRRARLADTGLSGRDEATVEAMTAQRRLLEELGGEYRRVTSNDVAGTLVDLARSENATQIVLGASARSRRQEVFGGSVINRVIRLSGPIDVHVISAGRR